MWTVSSGRSGRTQIRMDGVDDRHYWIFYSGCSTLWAEQRLYWQIQKRQTEQNWWIG